MQALQATSGLTKQQEFKMQQRFNTLNYVRKKYMKKPPAVFTPEAKEEALKALEDGPSTGIVRTIKPENSASVGFKLNGTQYVVATKNDNQNRTISEVAVHKITGKNHSELVAEFRGKDIPQSELLQSINNVVNPKKYTDEISQGQKQVNEHVSKVLSKEKLAQKVLKEGKLALGILRFRPRTAGTKVNLNGQLYAVSASSYPELSLVLSKVVNSKLETLATLSGEKIPQDSYIVEAIKSRINKPL